MTNAKPDKIKITELARKAADAFLSGNIIGGVGIVGLLMVVGAILIFEFRLRGPAFEDPDLYIGTILSILGVLLVLFCGILYISKKRMESATRVTLINGFQQITLGFIEKVNPGTVAAYDVAELSRSHYDSLTRLL